MIKVGLSTSAYYSMLETEQALLEIARHGVPVAEVFLQGPPECSPGFARELMAASLDTQVVSVHVCSGQMEPGLFSRSKHMHAYTQDTLRAALDVGAELGARFYVFHGVAHFQHAHYPPNYGFLAERVRPLMEYAAKLGITLTWENVFWCSFAFPEFAGEIAARLPEIGFTLDIKQAFRAGHGAQAYMAAMGGQLRHVHVVDSTSPGTFSTESLTLPGQGGYDFRRLGQELRGMGYDGCVILEPYANLFTHTRQLLDGIAFLERELNGG